MVVPFRGRVSFGAVKDSVAQTAHKFQRPGDSAWGSIGAFPGQLRPTTGRS